MGEAQKDVDRIFRENRPVVDEALKRGVRRAMLRHKIEGSSAVIERDGKIEWLKPEDLGFSDRSAGAIGCKAPRHPWH